MTKQIKSINDLTPDDNNANKGTLRGLAMLEDSLEQYGPGRSILVDAEGRVIAGNKTLQAAMDKGMEVVIVPTDGDKLVVVQRRDLDLKRDKRARELATADNRVAETDLEWDVKALLQDMESGQLDIEKFFDEDEAEALLRTLESFDPETAPEIGSVQVDDEDVNAAAAKLRDRFKGNKEYITVTCPHCVKEFSLAKKDVK